MIRQFGYRHLKARNFLEWHGVHSCSYSEKSDKWLHQHTLLAQQHQSDNIPAFENWLLHQGVKYRDHVIIKNAPNIKGEGRTCHAANDIEASTPVIQIPLHCLINSTEWELTPIGEIGLSSGVDNRDGNLFLSLALLQLWCDQNEKNGHNSFHEPYLNIIPRRLPHIPLFWGKTDISFLEGSPILISIESRRQEILDDFKTLQAAAYSLDQKSLSEPMQRAVKALMTSTAADFAVAEMTVCSRAFEVHGAGKGGRSARCLVPLADMLNTALPHTCDVDFKVLNVKDIDEVGNEIQTRKFVMHTLHSLKAGQQIFDSYGYKGNHRYLLNYGFSFEHNVRFDGKCPNEVGLVIKPPINLDPSSYPSVKIWGELALRVQLSVPLGNDISEVHGSRVLALLRFIACSEEELEVLINSHLRGVVGNDRKLTSEVGELVQRLLQLPVISNTNESKAWELFGMICDEALANYPTTASEDLAMLESCQAKDCEKPKALEKFSNQWNALVHVHGEKQILQYWSNRAAHKA